MSDFIEVLLSLALGMTMIVFRKFLVRRASKWGGRFFEFDPFKFKVKFKPGKKEEEIANRAAEVGLVILGSIFVGFSLLQLFGVIHVRH